MPAAAACAAGFHMAALVELLDPSTLAYVAGLGVPEPFQSDQGSGPPFQLRGWARTGMGGPRADIGAAEAIAGVRRVIAGLAPGATPCRRFATNAKRQRVARAAPWVAGAAGSAQAAARWSLW